MQKMILWSLSCATLFLLAGNSISFARALDLVGRKYSGESPLPNCKDIETNSLMLAKSGLILESGSCDGTFLLWLSRVDSKDDSQPQGKKTVVNQVVIRNLKKGEKFSLSPLCYFNSNPDKQVVFSAIFKGWKSTGRMTTKNGYIVEGWLLNESSSKMEKASSAQLAQISCVDESGGED
jgi:hypothetical protein